MIGTYAPWPQWNFIRPASMQDTYIFYDQVPVFLGGRPGTERVVLYTTKSRLKALAQIQRYDESTNKWVVEYQKEAEGIPYFSVLTGYWQLIRRNVVVLYSIVGSGGFLSYTVIGKANGKLVEYVSGKDIFQGGIWFYGGQLIEAHGVRQKLWITRNRRFTLIPYDIPIIPGAVVIEFSIQPNGKIRTKHTSYKVVTNSIVQLIRTDLNSISERVLYSYTPIMKYIPHRNAFKALDKGEIELTIIPGGYDWDKAVKIAVEVV